jgi:hypothetical protein
VPTPAIFGPAGRTFRKPCLIDEPLGFAQSCGIHEDYVLLFRCGLEEIASPAHQGGELVTTAERAALLQRTIEEIPAEIEAYDERVAIQNASLEARTCGKTATDYAIEALQQPDTPRGTHAVARAWLRTMSHTSASL